MAVREFDGADDYIRHDVGGMTAATFGTFAAIFKTDTVTGTHAMIYGFTSGFSFCYVALGLDGSQVNACANGFSGFGTIATGTWYLVVARKATGSANPRVSIYNFTATTWQHGNGSAAEANWTPVGAGGHFDHSFDGGAGDQWDGRTAVQAGWSNTLPYAASAGGDTAIEAAGLHTSLANWVTVAPTFLWPYNQADTSTPVDDIVGSSDQTELGGTTVVTVDDPPGFSFSLTSASRSSARRRSRGLALRP